MRKHYVFMGMLLLLCHQALPHGHEGYSLNYSAKSPSVPTSAAISVSGVVTEETGSPLPGVNILVKGTSVGTVTDSNGNYTISVPEDGTLVFSFIGYKQQEIAVGARTTIDIVMEPDLQSLEEIVVTALGIEKSTKSLGYATAKVSAEQLTVNRSPNLMNSLQGKIAGVNISGMGTGPGGTSKIRIRGQSSMSGQNNPLIVVNGVPIDNTNFGTNPTGGAANNDGSNAVRGGGNTSDGGDGLQSINPDDVESMTVLKGAAAAALYGSRAKDGVIMITTKTKGEGKGIGITYNLNYTSEKALDFTDYQYEYGQGEDGIRPTAANTGTGQWSFGEKFGLNPTYVVFNNKTIPYEPQRGIMNDFFRTGQNMTNSISVSSTTDRGGVNLSIANMDAKGIMPNNEFNRKTVNLGFQQKLSDRFSFAGSVNYSHEENTNPPNIGNQDNSIPTALYALANSMPLSVLDENKYDANGNEAFWSRFQNRTNPYFVLAKQFQNITRDRLFGNISMKYNIAPWLFVQGRVGQDYWSRDQDYNNFPNGVLSRTRSSVAGYVDGLYTQEQRRFRETNLDFLVNAKRTFGNFGVDVNAGGNRMARRSDQNSVQVEDFPMRDVYLVKYGRIKNPEYNINRRSVNSWYGSAEVNYKEFLYVTGTLREDYFSTLAPGNRSVLYSSISAGYVFSESFTLPDWFSSGKLRAAYGKVGSDGDVGAYSNLLYYDINAQLFANQPVGIVRGSVIPNAALHPMRVNEVEVGLDLKFLGGRLGLDVAAYEKKSFDQILSAQVSDASGFGSYLVNRGESRNRGIEAVLNAVIVESDNFNWEFIANTAYNKSKVLSLLTDKDGERITTAGHVFNGEVRQIVGEEMGTLSGFGYLRDTNGSQVFGNDGIPLATPAFINYGSALPRWIGGFTNNFNFKGIMLSVLIDYKLGGKMISGTNFNAVRHGLHMMTLPGRDGGVVGEGVNQAGEPNATPAPSEKYWETVRTRGIIEPIIYDAGYWKLRQITLGYDFTKHLPESFPLKGVKLSFVANNVLMIKKWVPNIDPESFGFASDNLVGLEAPGMPTTRSLGFNFNAKF